jgi:uncharacterized protein YecE (DUF72 family)
VTTAVLQETRVQLLAGTSGFSYAPWKGPFYPEDLPDDQMLRYYAARLPTVEINNTFYRMPSPRILEGWAGQVPDAFRFTLKAPRRITHDRRLAEVGDNVVEFVRRAASLGKRLGALLFQLPPYLKLDLPRLASFLDALPDPRCAALEFRSSSWHVDEVYDLLRQRGAMLCVTDTDEGETPFVATGREGYLRLRRTHYSDTDLAGWASRLREGPVERIYVYFMHEDDALGTRFAMRLLALWEGRDPETAGVSAPGPRTPGPAA